MAVKLRLKRMGSRHRPYYRVTAVDERRKRDGAVIEQLGHYNPRAGDEGEGTKLDLERCAYWLSVGARPSETVASLLRKSGLDPKPGKRVEEQSLPSGA